MSTTKFSKTRVGAINASPILYPVQQFTPPTPLLPVQKGRWDCCRLAGARQLALLRARCTRRSEAWWIRGSCWCVKNFFQSMKHEEQRGAFICNTRELLLTRKLVTLIPTVPEAACIHCSIFVIIHTATCDQTSPRNAHAHTPSTFSASYTWQWQYLQSFVFSVGYSYIHDLWCSIRGRSI